MPLPSLAVPLLAHPHEPLGGGDADRGCDGEGDGQGGAALVPPATVGGPESPPSTPPDDSVTEAPEPTTPPPGPPGRYDCHRVVSRIRRTRQSRLRRSIARNPRANWGSPAPRSLQCFLNSFF